MANQNDKKKKRPTRLSPKGEALFCHIVEPDYGTKEYPDEEGSFTLTLRLDAEASERLLASLKDDIEEAREQTKEGFAGLSVATRKKLGKPEFTLPGVTEYDRETEEPTGCTLFRFKTKASYTNRSGEKRAHHVPVFDSMAQPVTLAEEPGYGSLVKVSFTAMPYFVEGQGKGGLTLYLNAVQILKLNASGQRSAADYGFAADEAEEGGFMAEDVDTDPARPAARREEVRGSEETEGDEIPF